MDSAQMEGLCFDRSRDTLHFNNRERRECMCRWRSSSRSGSGKKREFSLDCLYFLSELEMRRGEETEYKIFEEIKA